MRLNKPKDFQYALNQVLLSPPFKHIILRSKNPKNVLSYFKSQMNYVRTAGGVVTNPQNEILFIYKRRKWDLPKGKIEKNESRKEAALREVKEETGVQKLKIIDQLEKTYHIGKVKGKFFFKQTTWFRMECFDPAAIRPQKEEGIKMVRWIRKSNLAEVKMKTYPNLTNMLKTLDR